MFNLKTAAEVKEAFKTVAAASAAYSTTVQEAAVQCIGHAVQHGDVTLATELLSFVRKHDAHILVAYFEANGPFRYQKADKAFEKNKAWKGEFDAEKMPHWENAKKAPTPKSLFDVDEALDRFLKMCHTQMKNAKSTKNAELLEMIEQAQALYTGRKAAEQYATLIEKAKDQIDSEVVKLPALKAA